MFNHQIDVSCVSETNLDSLNYKVKEILEACAGKQFERKVRLTNSSSAVKAQNYYKPGGTMTMTVRNYAGRVLKQGTDALGRWSYQYFRCKDNRCLVIITAYQVCRQEQKLKIK